jgi:RES domain-containing protein
VPLDVDAVEAGGDWIRHAPHRSSLLGRASVPTDGRWQRGRTVGALYLADERETAVAEWYRYLAERGLPATHAIPHDHHVWSVELKVANLSDTDRLARVGFDPPVPSRRTWPSFQDTGETLWREGWAGLLAPSAARPDHGVLCVFTTSWPPTGCTPLRSVEIAELPSPPRNLRI